MLVGPRIKRAGPTVNGKEFAFHQTAVTTEAEARAVVRALNKVGVDFIKIHRALPREAYFGVAVEAKKLGIPFAGHIPQTVAPEEASDAGQTSIEHAETLFEGTFGAQVAPGKFLEALARVRTGSEPPRAPRPGGRFPGALCIPSAALGCVIPLTQNPKGNAGQSEKGS